jgi:hypothetical protein
MPRTECSEIFWISFINAQDILAERRIQIFGPVKACCCPLYLHDASDTSWHPSWSVRHKERLLKIKLQMWLLSWSTVHIK